MEVDRAIFCDTHRRLEMSTPSTRRLRAARLSIGLAAGLAALVIAGCGGGSGGYGSTPSGTNAAASGGASIKLASSDLGKILVDAQGRTLYLFEADKGAMSACDGACASVWPPLTTKGKPSAATGLPASKLGTTKRSDGSTEVTFNGHPLYTYAGDSAPGQTSGQGIDGFGAEWYALSAAGNKIADE
jgi:predicted lipoprotein with Yx(FWY)xxD motif